MITTFHDQLRKIFGNDEILKNTKYVGRACIGSLDSELKVKAKFISTQITSQYNALRVAIINRKEGEIDSCRINLQELWGKKPIPGNPNSTGGVEPHLWLKDGKLEWYAFHPSPADMEQLREAVSDYIGVFREQVMEEDEDIKMM